jgi:hypothetical protein
MESIYRYVQFRRYNAIFCDGVLLILARKNTHLRPRVKRRERAVFASPQCGQAKLSVRPTLFGAPAKVPRWLYQDVLSDSHFISSSTTPDDVQTW